MAKRTPKKQSEHDSRVKRIAAGYKSQGYKVRADHVKGYKEPRTIYGKRPDLIARKGKNEVIVEVETRTSLKKDIPQRNAFQRFASLNKKRKFKTSVV